MDHGKAASILGICVAVGIHRAIVLGGPGRIPLPHHATSAPQARYILVDPNICPGPRTPTDVPEWLGKMGCTNAEWRIEVELQPPYSRESVTQGLYLHHLIQQTAVPRNTVCLPRAQFSLWYQTHLSTPPVVSMDTIAKGVLSLFCRKHGLPYCDRTGYPMQPRPHDLVPRDLVRLHECLATPNARAV